MFDTFSYDISQDLNYLNENALNFRGEWYVEHYREGALLGRYRFPNGITNVGKNYILDVGFNSITQISQSSWCVGIIDNAGFSALAPADTMSSHGGWSEFTSYSQSTRVAWGSGSASGQQISNATADTFDLTASGTLYGIFVNSDNTKGGTTGTLWSTAAFPTTIPVSNGDQLNFWPLCA